MKKIIAIIIISAITFIGGSLIVYSNTTKVIYDISDVLTIYDDGFKIMDFRFVYK